MCPLSLQSLLIGALASFLWVVLCTEEVLSIQVDLEQYQYLFELAWRGFYLWSLRAIVKALFLALVAHISLSFLQGKPLEYQKALTTLADTQGPSHHPGYSKSERF